MGARKERTIRFLAQHPLCYFCGGEATTIDHVPSRECFKDRVWPDGYAFPACEPCNRVSSQIEQVVALYMHLGNHTPEPASKQQIYKLIDGVANNNRDYMPTIDLSANYKRQAAREMGIVPMKGETYADLPIAELPEINREAFRIFERRLVCALFYKHIGSVLPPEYTMRSGHQHVSYAVTERLYKELGGLMTNGAEIKRQNTSLKDQFHYAWVQGIDPDNSKFAFAFVATFGLSYVVFGAAGDPTDVENLEEWSLHSEDLKHLSVD